MVNPFLNPVFSIKALKSYMVDIDRIWRISPEKMKRFQDKAFKKALKYAYTVPLYNKLYKEANIHPRDIKGIDDLSKLPTVSKNDIRNGFPDEIIPKNANKDKLWRINTSGATSKPLSFYRDTFGLLKDLFFTIRSHKFIGINWKKDVIVGMGAHTSPERYDHAVKVGVLNYLKPFFPSIARSPQMSYILKDLDKKIEQLNQIKPDYILGPPGDLSTIAKLRKKGYCKNINPKVVSTSGGMLDPYIKSVIEDGFNCKVYDIYSSVEMGVSAIQCEEGNYHVFSDHIYLEFLDDNGDPVASGEPGHAALTRLFGKGTPFIRYTGVEDILTPLYEKCPCGVHTTQLVKHINGKQSHRIHLPDGEYVTPVFFTRGVDAAMRTLKTDKILQYQVVQQTLEKIDILVVINEELRDKPPSIDTLFKEILKEYEKVFGDTFQFEIKEVKKVIGADNPIKPPPIILSKLNKGKYQNEEPEY